MEELTLLGRADLAWWTDRLEPLGLTPLADARGQAQVLIICASSRYLGIKFREVSFSILAGPRDAASWPGPGAFLLQAFNSVRWFAWCERRLFSTPYHFAEVDLAIAPTPRVAVLWNGAPIFSAELRGRVVPGVDTVSGPAEAAASGWRGPVYLPPVGSTSPGRRPCRCFLAEISGPVQVVELDPGRDQISLAVPVGLEVLQPLLDSGFAPLRGLIRSDAKHSKSFTFAVTA